MTPQYYISSYQFYNDILIPMIRAHFGMRGRKKAEPAINSFNKLVLFDQSVIMDQIRSLARQVETTANGVAEASTQLSSAAEQAGSATQGITDVSQQVTKGTAEQTESAKQTVESMRQLSGAIDEFANGT